MTIHQETLTGKGVCHGRSTRYRVLKAALGRSLAWPEPPTWKRTAALSALHGGSPYRGKMNGTRLGPITPGSEDALRPSFALYVSCRWSLAASSLQNNPVLWCNCLQLLALIYSAVTIHEKTQTRRYQWSRFGRTPQWSGNRRFPSHSLTGNIRKQTSLCHSALLERGTLGGR